MPTRIKPQLALVRPKSFELKQSILTRMGEFTCVFVINPNLELLEVNKSAVELLDEGPLVGKKITDLFFWAGTRKRKSTLLAHLATALSGETVQYETRARFQFAPQKVLYVDVNITPLSGASDTSTVDSIVITARNITKGITYQHELARTYSSYNKLIGANVVGMFVVDAHGGLSDINTAFVTLLGFTPQHFHERDFSWLTLFKHADSTVAERDLETLVSHSVLNPVEREIHNAVGECVPVILTGVRINNNPVQSLCMVIDISEQKRLDSKKDEFMSIASHELRTPLTTLKGYVQLMQLYIQQGRTEELQPFIDKVNLQVLKMISLIEDLLNSSRLDLGKMSYLYKDFDMSPFVADLMVEARSMYPNNKFELIEATKPTPVRADKLRMEQVLINLISNAVKYSPEHKPITIRVKVVDGNVRVEVKDHGMGIPTERIPFLFDKYYRDVNPKLRFTEGLGLGLYISAQILKQHQGEIGATSKINKGSTFFFSVPLRPPDLP